MATINADNSIPVDFLMVPCGEFSTAFSSAFKVCSPMDAELLVESLSSIFLDGVLNIEVLGGIGVNKAALVEFLREDSKFDFSISVEFLRDLSSDAIIPLSFLGEGIPIEVLSWVLSSREDVYVLSSRINEWVLLDRNKQLELQERLDSFTPVNRPSDWSL